MVRVQDRLVDDDEVRTCVERWKGSGRLGNSPVVGRGRGEVGEGWKEFGGWVGVG